MGWGKAALASVLALVAVLSVFAASVIKKDRSEGDYWVYQGDMEMEGMDVTGEFRYEFEESDSLTIGDESYDVNILRISGSMSAQVDDFLGSGSSVELEVTFLGYTYEVDGSLASVKEDMHIWTNMTIDSSAGATVLQGETQSVTTYSPPLPSGFVEGETGTGDVWTETVNVTSTTTELDDGVVQDTSTDEYEETYTYSVAASEEEVTTDAGTFSCLKMTATDSDGGREVYWYSSDVGSWVKMSMYDSSDSTPYMTLELTEYEYSEGSMMTILLIVLGVVVAVVVIVVLVMMMRRRGQTPVAMVQPAPPPMPLQAEPPAPPTG